MISIEEYAKLNNLVNSCDELISGKFILSEYKISKILKDIGESKEMYNLLAECMKNFNFEREYSHAEISIPRKCFAVPDQPEKLLPFVFCLLMEINNKKINLNNLLNTYFLEDDGTGADPFTRFVNKTVKPFKEIIVRYFELEKNPADVQEQNEEVEEPVTEVEKHEEPNQLEQENLDDLFEECESICNDILSEIQYEKKKDMIEDVVYITKTMISACQAKNFKYLSALITAFAYMTENLKSIRFLSRELKNILISFFA